jgi:para-nitrobenzyl esterase
MNGHAFADNDDIVTVTINYRLGALGFLYLGDVDKRYAASGNNGLLDCIMALRWIKENISSFGGDPNRITVMGESAGAKLLSAVMVAPKSKGLFRQLIAESGSVQCVRDTVTAKLARAKMLRQMGLSPQDASKLLTIPADSLMKIQAIVCAGIGGNSFFGPVYDGVIIKEDAYKYAGGENIPHIKALIGTNKYEAAAFVRPGENFANPDSTVFKPLFGATHQLVNRSYLQQLQTKAVYDALVNVLTQYMYQVHSYRFAKVLSQNGIPVWMYRFNFDNGLSFGAAHGRELHYIWNGYSSSTTDADSTNARLEHAMHSAWVAFIKTGNPNMKLLPPWPIYTNNSRRVMLFDAKDTVTGLTEVFDDKNFPSQVYMLK